MLRSVMWDEVPPLAEGCPWAELNHALGRPNLKWCEATQCSWITEPANTWSNLAYLAAAALMLLWLRGDPRRALRLFPLSVLAMGAFSFTYHASSTFLFQVFDFVGMFLFLFLPLVINAVRLRILAPRRSWLAYGALLVLATACVFAGYALRLPYQLLIAIFSVVVIATELSMPAAERPRSYRNFVLAVLLLATAQAFSLSDASRLFCDPDNHLVQGHAIWHLLSAAAIVFVFRHYATLNPSAAFEPYSAA